MQIKIELKGIDKVLKGLDDIAKRQVPKAMALALNRTAQKVKDGEVEEMKRVFDNPTPYTLSSIYIKKATRDNMVAEIGVKEDAGKGTPAANFLRPEIEGGARRAKRSERALQLSRLLPQGMSIVPSKALRLNQYGNITGSRMVQILSALKAAETMSGYTANVSARSKKVNKKPREYFVALPGTTKGRHLKPGVYERYGKNNWRIRPVLMFVKSPAYRPRFRFHHVGKQVAGQVWVSEFKKALADAISWAK